MDKFDTTDHLFAWIDEILCQAEIMALKEEISSWLNCLPVNTPSSLAETDPELVKDIKQDFVEEGIASIGNFTPQRVFTILAKMYRNEYEDGEFQVGPEWDLVLLDVVAGVLASAWQSSLPTTEGGDVFSLIARRALEEESRNLGLFLVCYLLIAELSSGTFDKYRIPD